MDKKYHIAEVEIDVVRLDSDIIDEHLRSSTAVLQEILKDDISNGELSGCEVEKACTQCGKLYKTKNTLYMHYVLKHPKNQENVQCHICEKIYPSPMSLKKHFRYMHQYEHSCSVCYKTFATSELLYNHAKHCSKCETPCEVCGKIFDSHVALRNHIKYKHPDSSRNCCELCRRTFSSSRGLSNHMATIHPPGATDCNSCHRLFKSAPALQSHVLYKHTLFCNRCDFCHKVFASKKSLSRHKRNIHSNKLEKHQSFINRNRVEVDSLQNGKLP